MDAAFNGFMMRSCPCPNGEEIAQIVAVGLIDAIRANSLANDALAQAKAVADVLPGGAAGLVDGAADAFRHCYWSCSMTQELGMETADAVANTHERCNPGSPESDAMDRSNNLLGTAIGSNPGGDCHDDCLQATLDGVLFW
jgi:hypothetical protein